MLCIVAMTRPKRHLCICGDSETISQYVLRTGCAISLRVNADLFTAEVVSLSTGWRFSKKMPICGIPTLEICYRWEFQNNADRCRK